MIELLEVEEVTGEHQGEVEAAEPKSNRDRKLEAKHAGLDDDRLVERIRVTSGREQKELLTELYWRFAEIIASLARRYGGRGHPSDGRDEAIAAGNLGLMEAAVVLTRPERVDFRAFGIKTIQWAMARRMFAMAAQYDRPRPHATERWAKPEDWHQPSRGRDIELDADAVDGEGRRQCVGESFAASHAASGWGASAFAPPDAGIGSEDDRIEREWEREITTWNGLQLIIRSLPQAQREVAILLWIERAGPVEMLVCQAAARAREEKWATLKDRAWLALEDLTRVERAVGHALRKAEKTGRQSLTGTEFAELTRARRLSQTEVAGLLGRSKQMVQVLNEQAVTTARRMARQAGLGELVLPGEDEPVDVEMTA